jgi:hypothetical protein
MLDTRSSSFIICVLTRDKKYDIEKASNMNRESSLTYQVSKYNEGAKQYVTFSRLEKYLA